MRSNSNNGTEGSWGGFRKAVAGTSGSTNGLQLKTVVPATLRYLTDVSKEQASHWSKDTRARMPTSTALYKFPVMQRLRVVPNLIVSPRQVGLSVFALQVAWIVMILILVDPTPIFPCFDF
jgi:hypothetical protein